MRYVLILAFSALISGCTTSQEDKIYHAIGLSSPADIQTCFAQGGNFDYSIGKCVGATSPEEELRKRQTAEAEQARAQAARQQVVAKAESHGYKLIRDFNDLLLDGKKLADNNAKIQLTGFYKKIGDSEFIFASGVDSYQESNNFVPILTDDAQRSLRAYFISFNCVQNPMGCQVSVGGHMTMCHYLNVLLTNYPSIPCLHVEVEIQ